MKTFKSFVPSLLALAVFLTSTFALVPKSYALFENAKNEACQGATLSDSTANQCDPTAQTKNVNSVLRTSINLLSIVVGVIAIIAIIIGGLKFIMSQGDSAGVSSAKNTIIYAIIGLIIVAMAQFIVRFVLNRATTPPPPKCAAGQKSTTANPCTL